MSLNKESINLQIYNMIKGEIINQKLKMGEQISPRQIAEENDISVMPVRDALLRLVNQGLVINKPRVGFFVRSFSTKEINEILEVRKMYEIYCLEEYFNNIDCRKVKKLYDYFKADRDEGPSVMLFNKYDAELHWAIVEASENKYLIERYKKLIDYYTLLFRYLNNQRYIESNEEHRKIIETILTNNKEVASNTLYNHLDKINIAVIKVHHNKLS